MPFAAARFLFPRILSVAALASMGWADAALAGEFSVTPIRAELKPGAMSETVTVTNHAKARLRVTIRLQEWSQGPDGADVYNDTGDIVYFPRQMDIEPESKRLVRIGAKAPGGLVERTYRLFIEEEPDPLGGPKSGGQVAFLLRFGVPIFVPPASGKPQAEMLEPVLEKGQLSIVMKNNGNQHFRVHRITLRGEGYSHDIAGWYSLAGAQRTYMATLPPDVCRRLGTLRIDVEGEGVGMQRHIPIDPAHCA